MKRDKCRVTSEVYDLLVKVFGIRHINKKSHQGTRDWCVRAIMDCLDIYQESCDEIDKRQQ